MPALAMRGAVALAMLGVTQNLKVLWPVVGGVFVAVVDLLIGAQVAP